MYLATVKLGLHLGNVRMVRQGVGGGGGTQRMHAEAVHIGIDADHGTLLQSMHLLLMQVRHFFGYSASNNRRICINSNISVCFRSPWNSPIALLPASLS